MKRKNLESLKDNLELFNSSEVKTNVKGGFHMFECLILIKSGDYPIVRITSDNVNGKAPKGTW